MLKLGLLHLKSVDQWRFYLIKTNDVRLHEQSV